MVARFLGVVLLVGVVGGMIVAKLVDETAAGVVFLASFPLAAAAAASKR